MSLEILKFKHPFTQIVAGTTSSGKTVWVRKLLANWDYLISNIEHENLRVFWCHGKYQNLYDIPIERVDIEYFEGVPEYEDILNSKPDIVVLDDLMNEIKNKESVKNLFTKDSHHSGFSVIYIVQNIFHQGIREISLNSHYIVVMKGIRLTRQVGTLGEQIFPNKSRRIIEIYKSATKKNYSYLIFDLHPSSIEKFCLRTRIFKDELPEHLASRYNSVPIFYEI